MNRARRSVIIIMSAIALAALSIPVLYYLEMRFSYHLTEVYMQDHAIPEDISFSSGRATDIRLNPTSDSVFYLACMPSEVSAHRSLRLSFSHFHILEINGQTFRSGDEIYEYASSIKNEPVTMRLFAPRGELLYDGYVQFMFADSVPTMYISTSENAIESINNDDKEKSYHDGTMVLITSEGAIDSYSEITLSKRGNASFDFYEIKPYNLNLDTPCSLLGMPSGRKWALRANGMDSTQVIRNELPLIASRFCSLYPCPDSRYINLYVNGKYSGLYLLSQRIKPD